MSGILSYRAFGQKSGMMGTTGTSGYANSNVPSCCAYGLSGGSYSLGSNTLFHMGNTRAYATTLWNHGTILGSDGKVTCPVSGMWSYGITIYCYGGATGDNWLVTNATSVGADTTISKGSVTAGSTKTGGTYNWMHYMDRGEWIRPTFQNENTAVTVYGGAYHMFWASQIA